MDKSDHYAGLILYRTPRNSPPEVLLFNDRHWAPIKGKVLGSETEFNCAVREVTDSAGLSANDFHVEDNFRIEVRYLSDTRQKRVVYRLAQINDHARITLSSEGLHYAWLVQQAAIEKVVYRSMHDALAQAFTHIEAKRLAMQSQRGMASADTNWNGAAGNHHYRMAANERHDGMKERFDNMRINDNDRYLRSSYGDDHHDPSPHPYHGMDLNAPRVKPVKIFTGSRKEGDNYFNPAGPKPSRGDGNGRSTSQEDNPLYKTRMCERFTNEGFCPYQEKCTFAHGEDELRGRPTNPVGGRNDPRLDGSPASFNRQKESNALFKTRLCERFVNDGSCEYGSTCTFAHGESELRNRLGNGALNHPSNKYPYYQTAYTEGHPQREFSYNNGYNDYADSARPYEDQNRRRFTGYEDQPPRGFTILHNDQHPHPHHQQQHHHPPHPHPSNPSQPSSYYPSSQHHPPSSRRFPSNEEPILRPHTGGDSRDWRARSSTSFPAGVVPSVNPAKEQIAQNGVQSVLARRPLNLVPRTNLLDNTMKSPNADKLKSPGLESNKSADAQTGKSENDAREIDVTGRETKKDHQRSHPGSPLPSSTSIMSISSKQGSAPTLATRPGGNKSSSASSSANVSLKDLLSREEDEKLKVVELSTDEKETITAKKPPSDRPSQKAPSKDETLASELTKFLTTSFVSVDAAAAGTAKDKLLADEIKEITRLEFRNDLSKTHLFNILIPSFCNAAPGSVQKNLNGRPKLIKTFVRSNADQTAWLFSWERYLSKTPTLVNKAAGLFKLFYDNDWVEEDVFITWNESPPTTGSTSSLATTTTDGGDVRKKVAAFIEWLKCAEEED